jgi:glycosyltransferase involved in cell wall biosynthesis
MKKQNIYFDALPLAHEHMSGIGNVLFHTINSLSKNKEVKDHYKVYLVVPLGKAKYLPVFESGAVTPLTLPLPARVFELFIRINVMIPVDLILGKGIYVFINYKNWPLLFSRSLTYIHDATFARYPEYVQPKNRRYLTKYVKRWIRRSDKVVTGTENAKNEISRYLHIPEEKIEIIPHGVDQSHFYPRTQKEINKVKKKYNISSKKYLLYVGNIEPRKNLKNLIEAYCVLPAEITDMYALVVVGGDGWLNDDINKSLKAAQAKGYQVIRVEKNVTNDDLPAIYSGATALVHPAFYEGFGLTPLEAMACEVPVISSNASSLPEVVGDAAELFNPTDLNSMTEAITKVIHSRDRQKELVMYGNQRVSLFRWSQTSSLLIALIDDQFALGYKKKIVRKFIKRFYKFLDKIIRHILGERELSPYKVADSTSREELKKQIFQDFLDEQPSLLQGFLLKGYLYVRHTTAKVLKWVVATMRSLKS